MMLRSATVARLAPAKINLTLRIQGRREDGYHLLESLFLPLNWGDTVRVRVESSKTIDVRCHCSTTRLSGSENLASRAARAYLEARKIGARIHIALHKRTWVAAGLGGGSSDAAAVLRVLTALDPTPLPARELADLALSLGADIPFFLDPSPAKISGIGEIRAPLAAPSFELLLVNPDLPLSTAEVFEALRLKKGEAPRKGKRPALPDTLHSTEDAAIWVENDLEQPAERLCPAIGALRREIKATGALAAGLSGSGPTLFGLYPSAAAAEGAQRELGAKSQCLLVQCRSVSGLTPR